MKRVYDEHGADITPLSRWDRLCVGLRMLRWKIRNNRRLVLLLARRPRKMIMTAWLLNHPSRFSWLLIELFGRPLPLRWRLANAWWQFRHYGKNASTEAGPGRPQ